MKALIGLLRAGFVLRLCALALCSTCSEGAARADGWLSSMNPFAAKKPAPDEPKHLGDSGNKAGLGNSKPAAKPAPAKAAPSQPSIFSKMSSGASSMMNKTKSVFKPSPKPDTTFKLGSKTVTPKPTESTSSWNPFASKTPPADPPRTASQFIGLPRPGLQ